VTAIMIATAPEAAFRPLPQRTVAAAETAEAAQVAGITAAAAAAIVVAAAAAAVVIVAALVPLAATNLLSSTNLVELSIGATLNRSIR
jgi:hypothetical protein